MGSRLEEIEGLRREGQGLVREGRGEEGAPAVSAAEAEAIAAPSTAAAKAPHKSEQSYPKLVDPRNVTSIPIQILE